MRLADVFVAVRADMTDFNQALSGIDQGMAGLSKNLGAVGRGLTTNVTLPILAAGGATSKFALDFNRTMGQVVGLAGVSAHAIDGISDEIKEMASDVGQDPQKLAEAFYFVASAGFEAQEAMDVLRAAAKGSAAGLGEVQSVAQVLGGVINSYGKENLSAAAAADILTKAVSEGAAEADSFASVLPQVVPTAAMLSVEFEEVAGALAAMTTTGASASQAAVGLNQVFTTLLKPTVQANKTLASFGLSAERLRTILREQGTIAVLRLLEQTFGDNEEAMTKVFGNVRAMRAAFSLLGLDAEQLDAIMASVADSSGALDDAFAAIPEEVLAFDRAMADLKVTAIELGSDVLPTVVDILKRVSDGARAAARWWKSLDDDTKGAVIQFALFAAAAGPVLTILGKLVTVARFAVKGFGALVNAGKLLHTAWLHIPTLMGFVDLALAKITARLPLLGRALTLALGPLGAVAAALALLATLGPEVNKALNPIGFSFNELASTAGRSRQQIEGEIHALADELGISTEEAKERVVRAAEAMGVGFDEAMDLVEDGWKRLPRIADRELTVFEGEIYDHMLAAKGIARDGAAEIPAEVADILEAGRVPVGEAADLTAEEIAEALEKAKQDAAEQAQELIDALAGVLAEGPDQIKEEMDALVDALVDPYKDAARRADLEVALMQDEIAKNLKSGDSRTEALAFQQVNNWLAQYDLLEPGALARGELLNPAFREGIESNLAATLEWYRVNVAGEFVSLSDVADQLDRNGYNGLAAYARGVLRANRLEVYNAITTFRRQATSRTELDLWGQGNRAGHSWINGYMSTLSRAQAEFYRYASTVRGILPSSEPKDPRSPWRGITKIGASAAMEIIDGWRSTLPTFQSVLGQFGGLPAMTNMALAPVPTVGLPERTGEAAGTTQVIQLVLNGDQFEFGSARELTDKLEKLRESWG